MLGLRHALAALLLCPTVLHSQADTTARLMGYARSAFNGRPLAGVMIAVPAARQFVVTDSTGTFDLASVPSGRQRVRIAYEGRETEEYEFELRRGKTKRLAVLLDVRAVASADRRFVTLELRPTLIDLVPDANGSDLPQKTVSLATQNSSDVTIELPELRIQRLRTTATIPDGATLMIGGFMGVGTPERLIDELVRQGRRNLTVIANDNALPGIGIGKLITAGLVRKTIASHIGLNPETQKKMIEGLMEYLSG